MQKEMTMPVRKVSSGIQPGARKSFVTETRYAAVPTDLIEALMPQA